MECADGKFIGRHGKGMVIPMVEIRWDGIRRRIELLLPLDQVEDKPWVKPIKYLVQWVEVPSWQFVRFGRVDMFDILDGNRPYESSNINGQTAL